MTPEQLRIYNNARRARGMPLHVQEDDDAITTFQQQSKVIPYTTGLPTAVKTSDVFAKLRNQKKAMAKRHTLTDEDTDASATDNADFERHVQDELNWISQSTQYLFDAVDAAQEAYNNAIAAGKTAEEAIQDAAQAAQDASDAASKAQEAADKAQEGVDTANSAIQQVEAQTQAIAQAQTDATNALINANNAYGIAEGANTTAGQAISDAADARSKAEDAQNQAIAANSAAIAAQNSATDNMTQTLLASPKSVGTGGAVATINAPQLQNKYLVLTLPFTSEASASGSSSNWSFYLNGVALPFRWRTGTAADVGDYVDWTTQSASTQVFNGVEIDIQVPAGQTGAITIGGNNTKTLHLTAGFVQLLPSVTEFGY